MASNLGQLGTGSWAVATGSSGDAPDMLVSTGSPGDAG